MADEVNGLHQVEQIMGMPIGIDVRDRDVDPSALDRVFEWFRTVDAIFSTYRSDSEISRINRGELDQGEGHPDVREVLERCEQLRLETDGFFDVRDLPLPEESGVTTGSRHATLDPSGLVKGWSVDRAAGILEGAGARNYAINAGGDIKVRGGALPAPSWRVGIQHPIERDKVAAVVSVSEGAVATSGAYARGAHIVDPHTGEPPRDVFSVTITGPELATADAYATAAYAMGEDGPAWTAQLRGYEGLTIMADGRVLSTEWFPRA